jgi:hypothetical protein
MTLDAKAENKPPDSSTVPSPALAGMPSVESFHVAVAAGRATEPLRRVAFIGGKPCVAPTTLG